MKGLVLLLLSLQGYAEGMIDCGQDKGFRIIKNDNASAYQLQLCTSTGNCTNFTLFDEPKLCVYCNEISVDCYPSNECMTHINSFFTNYYGIFDHSAAACSPFTPKSITQTDCISEVLSIVTTTVTTERMLNTCTNCKDTRAQTVALGALTGLLLVILVLVVTGWVWTYWTVKKKKKETQLCKNCQEQESEKERFCLNQIQTMPTTQPVVGTAVEQLLHSLEESGRSNNGLSSKDNKGHCDVQRVENFYTSSEGSTNSSLQRERAVNRVEEGESGEKHVYHVLEKPGGDDYEDPDKDLEENTAMEYETPLPLKELGLKHASIHTN